MIKPANSDEKYCENCGKVLFGRTDKRFCNDTCRNTFNREKNLREQIKEHENLPEIFRIIKHNYRILKSFGELKAPNEGFWIDEATIWDQGFDERFFTSVYLEGDKLFKFCF